MKYRSLAIGIEIAIALAFLFCSLFKISTFLNLFIEFLVATVINFAWSMGVQDES